MAVKPVSNGDPPCARTATGMTTRATRTAVKRAHFDRNKGWIRWVRRNCNQQDDICASGSAKLRCLWRKSSRTPSSRLITSHYDVMFTGYQSGVVMIREVDLAPRPHKVAPINRAENEIAALLRCVFDRRHTDPGRGQEPTLC